MLVSPAMGKRGGRSHGWSSLQSPAARRKNRPLTYNELKRERTRMHCRTLEDMSEKEIQQLEFLYECPVIRPESAHFS